MCVCVCVCCNCAGDLGEPVLLPVWFSISGVHHPDHRLLRGGHCDDLLPAVWGGLPLVVEVLHALWLLQLLCAGLLLCLLLHKGVGSYSLEL